MVADHPADLAVAVLAVEVLAGAVECQVEAVPPEVGNSFTDNRVNRDEY